MKSFLIVLSLFLFLSLWFVIGSEAIPTCTFRTTCGAGEVCIFEALQENNTHAGSCDSPYTIKVCCTEITSATIRSSCLAGEGDIVSLYATSNSHAGRRDHYSNVVCAKTANNSVVANIRPSCISRETCAFTMFQENNTHVGRCNYYGNRMCIQEFFNVTTTMILNTTTPNWNDIVQLRGVATRADASTIDTSNDPEDVEVFMNGSRVCATDTNSSGGYTCNFTAPRAIGLYQLNITIDDPTTIRTSWNATTFTVRQEIGVPSATTEEQTAEYIACYEEPRILQNPDGTIEVSIVRICVWK